MTTFKKKKIPMSGPQPKSIIDLGKRSCIISSVRWKTELICGVRSQNERYPCVFPRKQEERAGDQKGTQRTSEALVMFSSASWSGCWLHVCIHLWKCIKLYNYDLSTLWYKVHSSIKIYIKKGRTACSDSHPWPLTYHSSPSKPRL